MSCAFCKAPLTETFVDLGKTPLANRYLTKEMLAGDEPFYPLHAYVCTACLLVQVPPVVEAGDIFGDYAYFSSTSAGWVEHARKYSAQAIERFSLNGKSRVIEVASNDGYLLKNFVAAGIPCLGVEPARNIAAVAGKSGVPTLAAFFGRKTAEEIAQGGKADLMAANNVLAHVPDINDFVSGFAALLAEKGAASFEFPHILNLIQGGQFDTIYHEHYSYYSLFTLEKIFAAQGLAVFDAEELPTHGGSLRLWVGHKGAWAETPAVAALRQKEVKARLDRIGGYRGFAERVRAACDGFKSFLREQRRLGRRVAAYGAAAKGNTLLNVCGITAADIEYVCDLSPSKRGLYLPGTHIPVVAPEKLRETKPDVVIILPWNIAPEVMREQAAVFSWGGRFVTAIPALQVREAA